MSKKSKIKSAWQIIRLKQAMWQINNILKGPEHGEKSMAALLQEIEDIVDDAMESV